MQPPARCSNHRCVYIDQCDLAFVKNFLVQKDKYDIKGKSGSRVGDKGPGPPFFINTGPNPLNNHTTTKPAFIVRLSPLKWRFAGGPMVLYGSSVLPSSTKQKNRKNVVRVGPPLTKLSGSAHALSIHLIVHL